MLIQLYIVWKFVFECVCWSVKGATRIGSVSFQPRDRLWQDESEVQGQRDRRPPESTDQVRAGTWQPLGWEVRSHQGAPGEAGRNSEKAGPVHCRGRLPGLQQCQGHASGLVTKAIFPCLSTITFRDTKLAFQIGQIQLPNEWLNPNAKLSRLWFCHCHENGHVETISAMPDNQFWVSNGRPFTYSRLIRVYPSSRQREPDL